MLTALPWFERNPPEFDEGPAVYFGADAVFLLRQSGAAERAEGFIAYSDWMDRYLKPVKGPETGDSWAKRARLATAARDRAGLLRSLTALYDTGGLIPAYQPHEPMFKPFANDPDIVKLLAKFEVRRAEWHKQLAAEGL